MKKLKSLFSVMIVTLLVIASLGSEVEVNAASYPDAFFYKDAEFKDLIVSDEATVGETVYIRMYWFAKFNHEGYDLVVYDSNGTAVAHSSDTFSNIDYTRKFTITWDTTGCAPGIYTVEVTKQFYSYYRWNEAPTKEHLYITLKDNKSTNSESLGKVKGVNVKNVKGKKLKVKYNGVKKAKKYKIQYSLDKKFKRGVKTKKTSAKEITIKNLKKNKTYYVRVCALSGNKKGAWSSIKKIKIKK